MPAVRRSSAPSAAATSFRPASVSPIRSRSTAIRIRMRSFGLPFLLLAACSADNGSNAAPAGQSGIDATGAAASSTPLNRAPFAVQELARFDDPWALAFLPGGAALVTQKGGQLKLWQPGAATIDVAGVPRVVAGGQGGLLDVILSPDFASDNLVYLTY